MAARAAAHRGRARGARDRPARRPERSQAGGARRSKKVLRRGDAWPLDRFGVVVRAWDGCTAVCIGGGPSLTPAQVWAVKRARGQPGARVRVIAINNAYALAPWADVLYFADLDWWQRHRETPEYRAFGGEKVTIEPTGFSVDEPGVYLLHNAGELGISSEPNALATGGNSGHQAINLAVLAGARRVLLLGYDMGRAGERTHWHAGHPARTDEAAYMRFRAAAASAVKPLAALGVEIINCSGGTLECFPRAPLESVLPDPRGAGISA